MVQVHLLHKGLSNSKSTTMEQSERRQLMEERANLLEEVKSRRAVCQQILKGTTAGDFSKCMREADNVQARISEIDKLLSPKIG